jgi:hypothetical protein
MINEVVDEQAVERRVVTDSGRCDDRRVGRPQVATGHSKRPYRR